MKNNMPTFIAIDGHGGSGKSMFADMLAQAMQAEIIHIDDFTGADSPADWHKKVIAQVFEPIASGAQTLTYAPAQWWQQHTPEPITDQPVTPIMILEGVGSLRKELRPFVSFGIFVDTPREVCLERGLTRDRGMDGKSDEQILQWWNNWLDADEAYFSKDDPKSAARYIVNGVLLFDDIITEIKKTQS